MTTRLLAALTLIAAFAAGVWADRLMHTIYVIVPRGPVAITMQETPTRLPRAAIDSPQQAAYGYAVLAAHLRFGH